MVQAAATVAAVPLEAASSGLSQLTAPQSQTVSDLGSTGSGSIDATNTVVLGGVAMSAIAFMGMFSVVDYLVSGGLFTPVLRRNDEEHTPRRKGLKSHRSKDGGGKVRQVLYTSVNCSLFIYPDNNKECHITNNE